MEIKGFNNLLNIFGDFEIYNNTNLDTIEILPLTKISTKLLINNNEILTNVNLPNLKTVSSSFIITNNPFLSDLNGFVNLATIGSMLQLNNNNISGSLSNPFNSLVEVSGIIDICPDCCMKWEGFVPESSICKLSNPCQNNFCLENQTCLKSGPDDYICFHGICTGNAHVYTCFSCSDFTYGSLCDVCDCVQENSLYCNFVGQCECKPGFYGLNCSGECDCENDNYICDDGINGIGCSCIIDDCSTDPMVYTSNEAVTSKSNGVESTLSSTYKSAISENTLSKYSSIGEFTIVSGTVGSHNILELDDSFDGESIYLDDSELQLDGFDLDLGDIILVNVTGYISNSNTNADFISLDDSILYLSNSILNTINIILNNSVVEIDGNSRIIVSSCLYLENTTIQINVSDMDQIPNKKEVLNANSCNGDEITPTVIGDESNCYKIEKLGAQYSLLYICKELEILPIIGIISAILFVVICAASFVYLSIKRRARISKHLAIDLEQDTISE
eukprot:TRINITY_DN5037_c0_g2_i2.p1 TRINITY_DN5037_c0_g2~~TRINITY_DN5037_c0_g2_i2.p1  ORF type:complete len:544 (-),score=86.29 TRINITY_DN5037_c0_g2_i2:50-1561(-)